MNKSSSLKSHYLLAIIVLLAIGVYCNTLSNGFVYDDKSQVLENKWITDIKYIPEIFSNNTWGFDVERSSSCYRPLMLIIYMINYHLFGFSPWGFHLVNIIFHAGVSVLVFLIAGRLLNRAADSFLSPPFIAAVLFAVHPIHTEAVAWVAGMPDLSFTFFYLLSFYFYMRSTQEGEISKCRYLLSVVLFFLASLSKEPALTFPIILVAYDYTFRNAPHRLTDYIKRYLPYLTAAGMYLILRIYALNGFAPVKSHAELTGYQYFINIFPLFAKYLEKLVFPIYLNAYHVLHPAVSIFEPEVMMSIAVFLGFTFLVYLSLKRYNALFLSLLFISVPLLPALYIPAVGENAFAERYLYLPSFGFVMLLALLLERVRMKKEKWVIALAMGILFLTGAYSFETIRRNTIWKDDYSLWMDVVNKSPENARAHVNLGAAYKSQGLIDKAIEEYRTALKLDPFNLYAHYNLANNYMSQGLIEKAVEYYLIVIKLKPDYLKAHVNLGNAYKSQGLIDKAIEHYLIAVKLSPNPETYYNLANAYMSQGLIDKAIEYYLIAVKLKPDYPDAHNNLGVAYGKLGMHKEEIESYKSAITIKPDYAAVHFNLGVTYIKLSDRDSALREYEILKNLDPKLSDELWNLIHK